MAAIIHLMQTAMPPRASSSKTAIIAGTLAGLLAAALGATYVYQHAQQERPEAATAGKVEARQEEQAVMALMALPELKAWAAHIEKVSQGRAHGAVMLTAPEQREVEGQSYYQLSFLRTRRKLPTAGKASSSRRTASISWWTTRPAMKC